MRIRAMYLSERIQHYGVQGRWVGDRGLAPDIRDRMTRHHEIGLRALLAIDDESSPDGAAAITDRLLIATGEWRCCCEAHVHFPKPGCRLSVGHAYLMAPAGMSRARYVGRVCDSCAATCMKDFLL